MNERYQHSHDLRCAMNQKTRRVLCMLFILYGLLMLWLLFGQRFGADLSGTYWERLQNNVNLVPFRTIKEFIHTISVTTSPDLIRHSVINLAGNVVMFVPLGFFPPCIWNALRSFARCMLGVAACILIIELIQLFTLLGSCDVDDLILNMVGVAIGYGLYRLFALFLSDRNGT